MMRLTYKVCVLYSEQVVDAKVHSKPGAVPSSAATGRLLDRATERAGRVRRAVERLRRLERR